jgi:hypothetical protein
VRAMRSLTAARDRAAEASDQPHILERVWCAICAVLGGPEVGRRRALWSALQRHFGDAVTRVILRALWGGRP